MIVVCQNIVVMMQLTIMELNNVMMEILLYEMVVAILVQSRNVGIER